MSNKGPDIHMGMHLSLTPQLRTTQEMTLEPEEKRKIQIAIDLWNKKSHVEFSFKTSDLLKLLNKGKRQIDASMLPPGKPPEDPAENDIYIKEIIFLTNDEMELLDPDEKVGGVIGDILYVNENAPKAYVAFIVMNLTILSWISDEKAEEAINMLGLSDLAPDHDEGRHWSANLFDIILAEQSFGTQSKDFASYLKWRKAVERSDFFQSPIIDQFVRSKIDHEYFQKTTHPLKRGKWSNISWRLAQNNALNEATAEFARDFGCSRVDIVLHRIAQEKTFNGNDMLALIEHIKELIAGYSSVSACNVDIDLNDNEDLDNQAYLLTCEVTGYRSETLERPDLNNHALYRLKPQGMKTLRAIEKKLAYFERENMLNAGINPENINYLKVVAQGKKKLSIPEAPEIDLNNPDAKEQLKKQSDANTEKIEELQRVLAELRKFETKMKNLAQSNNINLVPVNIEIDIQTAEASINELVKANAAIEECLGLINDISDLRERHDNVLRSIPLTRSA